MKHKPTLLDLRWALEQSWSRETTYCTLKFRKRKAAEGQCLVSSLVIQDYFGGELKYGEVKCPKDEDTVGHYWLRINDVDVDFTWHQFPIGSKLIDINATDRNAELDDFIEPHYQLLAKKVKEKLGI